MRRSLVLAAVLIVALPGVAQADVGGPDVVSFLNAQRAASGIPAGIVEDPVLSAGCLAHDDYGATNHVLVHTEDPSLPGYSAAGKTAAETSVLYSGGGPWTALTNPFEQAPIHLHQLLSPRLDRMGAAEIASGYGCATTLASRARPAPGANITYTYPGDGATGWWVAQTAAEGPYTPGQQVGIAAGTKTGPYLYVSFDGPALNPFASAQSTGATLTGPHGAVTVAVADNTTAGLTNYLPTGMEVIPRAPLEPMSTYTASVSANVTPQGGGAPIAFTKSWSFTTGGKENAAAIYQLTPAAGGDLSVLLASTAPDATVTAAGPGTAVSAAVHLSGSTASTVLRLDRAGVWRVCVRSGGGASEFHVAEGCRDVVAGVDPPPVVVDVVPAIVAPAPPVVVTPPAVVAPKALASWTTGVKARLRGRSLTVPVRCAAACTLKVTGTLTFGTRKAKLSGVTFRRTSAGTLTVRFTLSKTVARRVRAARKRSLALTVVARPAKGAATTLRKSVAVSTG